MKNDKSETRYKAGFDNPLSDPDFDQLDRKRLISHIYSHLTNLEPEWSVRVGFLAPWGAGKTTICRWVASEAEKDGHIPVFFSPWAARTDGELWVGFYTALTSALISKGKKIKFSRATIKHMTASLLHRGWADSIGQLHQAGQTGIEVVRSIASINDRDIKHLYEQIKGKRFIVILDDLDRVDPVLIPRLLMTLRDIMDMEGFSFLLPFDDRIVADALKQYNSALGFGENFLEKILDFRVHLSKPAENTVMAFFRHEIQSYCSFIPVTALEGLEKFLPINPRRLKSLVRGLRVFDAEAKRHRPDEIDWKALIFAQMIKLEDEAFYNLYIKDTFFREGEVTFEDTSGIHPWTAGFMERDQRQAEETEKSRITELLDKASVEIPERRERLIQLCEGWRHSCGVLGHDRILYALKLLVQPETLTWAEFDALWAAWSQSHNLLGISPWISGHAKKNEKPLDEVIREVLLTLIQQYNSHLEKASSVALKKDNADCIQAADEILTLIDLICTETVLDIPHKKILTADILQKLIGVIAKWFHFRGNQADREQRGKEETLVKKWVQKANDLGMGAAYHGFLVKLDDNRFGDERDIGRLYKELIEMVGPALTDDALAILKKSNGIKEVFPDGANEGIKRVLLDAGSDIWKITEGQPSSAEEILATAAIDAAVQINARDFLDLLKKASAYGTWELRTEQVSQFYTHPELVVSVWNAAIATELQYRRLKETRQIRDYLIAQHIPAASLATPAWLMVGHEEPQKNQAQAAEQ
ncbi:MAG: P-loop NTPase fold protein [Alphaproteobacteria bacterium]